MTRADTSIPTHRAPLERIGWRPDDEAHLPADFPPQRRVVRIIAQHRSGYRAHDGESEFAVQAPAAMIRAGVDPRERAVVGDWAILSTEGEPTIESLLPRRTLLERAAAGERYQHQPIAANVDYVLIVCGLDDDYSPRRIERYLVIVQGSGALPVIVLTKSDLCEEVDARIAELRALAGPAAMIHAVNARDLESTAALSPYVQRGDSAVLVGSSGAGKSTLTNSLLGIERQKTGAVRESDSRGRHTTTHRALIMLPDGGCLIDTPGMREIKLTGDEDLGEATFGDIEDLAHACRFSDCRHGGEPGCAVRAALDDGTLDPARYANYAKLREELGAAKNAAEMQRRKKSDAKVQDKALGKRLNEKYGRRGS